MANGFSLDEFMSANADFARGYTFYVDFGVNSYLDVNTRFLVKSSSLPVGTISPIETNWQGNIYKLGSTQEFTDFTVSFNADTEGLLRTNFTSWQQDVHNPETNKHGNPNDYMIDMQVQHLSHITGDVMQEYKLVKAFPSSVGELALDYASKEIATFDVTFSYQRHYQTN